MQIERSMVSGFLSVSLLSLWLCCGAYGQSAGLPEFEAAAVRVNNSGATQSGAYDPRGQLTLRGVTMRMLVGIAWKETRTLPDLTALEIAVAPSVAQFNTNKFLKGGPAWLDSERFDVTAKAPGGHADGYRSTDCPTAFGRPLSSGCASRGESSESVRDGDGQGRFQAEPGGKRKSP